MDEVRSKALEPLLVTLTGTVPLEFIAVTKPSLNCVAVLDVSSPKLKISPFIARLWVPVAVPDTDILFIWATLFGFTSIPAGTPIADSSVGLIVVALPLNS